MDPNSQDEQRWMSMPEPEPEPGLVGSSFLAEHGLCDDDLQDAVDTSNFGLCDPASNLQDTKVPLANLTEGLSSPPIFPLISPNSNSFASELSIAYPTIVQNSQDLGRGTSSNDGCPDLVTQTQAQTAAGTRNPINTSHVTSSPRSHSAVQLRRQYFPRQASGLRSEYQIGMSTNTPSPKIQTYEHQLKSNPASLSHQFYQHQGQGTNPTLHNYSQAFEESSIRSSKGELAARSFTHSPRPIWHSSTPPNCQQYPQHSMAHSPQANDGIHSVPQSSIDSNAGNLSQLDRSQSGSSKFRLSSSTHPGAPVVGKAPSSTHNNTSTRLQDQFSANMNFPSSSSSRKRPASGGMYRETSSPISRISRVKQETGNELMKSLATDPRASQLIGSPRRGQNDVVLVALLVDSMNDMDATEDNHGMLSTWRKLMVIKADKIQRVCEELLVRLWAHRQHFRWQHSTLTLLLGDY